MKSSKWTTLSRCLLLVLVILLVTAGVTHVTRSNLKAPADDLEEIYESGNPHVEALKVAEYEANLPQDNKGKRLLENEGRSKKPASNNQYSEVITNAQKSAMALLDTEAGWTKKRGDSLDGEGLVYTRTAEGDTVFKLEGNIDIDALTLYEDMAMKPQEVATWNTNVVEQRVLEKVDNSSDIVYSLSRKSIVSNRDFVFIRHWEKKDEWYLVSSVSVTHPSKPEDPNYVRAEQKPTVIRMKEIGPNKLRLEWLLHVDLNLSVPMMFVKSSLLQAMTTFLKDLRGHAAALLSHT
ncbi:steroidogenic acute regulatory protein, mitochondrial-like [Watersipora subatra]|uniref:steroidogenic acute regulatory protein, mitochondrial-like n=1 Tax=Watersipora subatra TaxID=2589382 RepID=UPI00355C5F8F